MLLALVSVFLDLKLDGLAAALALSFHCFLRTTEVLCLLAGDVVLGNGVGSVVLRVTKKKEPDIIPISDRLVLYLCSRRKADCLPGDTFCGVVPQVARNLLKAALDILGLTSFGYRWYSLRRGGATYFFQRSGSMDLTLKRGRWDSPRTANLYITEGILSLHDTKLDLSSRSPMAYFLRKFFARVGDLEGDLLLSR